MIKAFKDFWIDYWKLCQESMKWLKKHWLGYIILTIAIFAITLFPAWLEYRKMHKEIKKIIDDAPHLKVSDLI